MILSELRDYLQIRGRATIADLSARFDTEPDALRGMLQKWIGKGKVERLVSDNNCGGCCKCDDGSSELYLWKG